MSSIKIKTVYDWAAETEDPEPKMCKQFGCGRKLDSFEQLCGEYCADHSIKPRKIAEWDLDIDEIEIIDEETMENA